VNRFTRLLCASALLAAVLTSPGCENSSAASIRTPHRYVGRSARVLFVSPLPASLDSSTPVRPAAQLTMSKRPAWAKAFTGVVNGVRTNEKVVALTFDDGPSSRTRELVDDLHAAGAHATFFWIGSRITTDAAEYAISHHEELANHTWSHPNMLHLTSQEASAQIGRTSARIAQFTGAPPTWFRSPFSRLYRHELAQIRAHGLLYANFEVTSGDWTPGSSEADILNSIDSRLRPGSIIVMHDIPSNDLKFLPAALRLLKQRGYRLGTLTTLAQMGSPVDAPLTLGVRGLGR
jgi:peptidoglycan-N-acetylglucosamine deacetylase